MLQLDRLLLLLLELKQRQKAIIIEPLVPIATQKVAIQKLRDKIRMQRDSTL